MRFLFVVIPLLVVVGCIALEHKQHLLSASQSICLPVEPPTPTGWFCYPVDMKSGQQMCVRQMFNPQGEW